MRAVKKLYGGRVPRTGRPRAFDEQLAVEQARDLFWTRGYAATSIQDLVDELHVQRGSLYGAFGDKRSLYLRALALYVESNQDKLEALLATDPVLPSLRRMLVEPATLTGAAASTGPSRGCMVGNATVELASADGHAAQAPLAAAYDGFVTVVASALRRAQVNGEVTTTSSPEAQARLALLLFQGSALVERAGPNRDELSTGIDIALDALRQRP
jgi:TetR/AcrR family transcriptional repressor of nem operon